MEFVHGVGILFFGVHWANSVSMRVLGAPTFFVKA